MKRFLKFITVLIPACLCLSFTACKRDAQATPADDEPIQELPIGRNGDLPVPQPELPAMPEERHEHRSRNTAPPRREFYPMPYIRGDGRMHFELTVRSLPHILIRDCRDCCPDCPSDNADNDNDNGNDNGEVNIPEDNG